MLDNLAPYRAERQKVIHRRLFRILRYTIHFMRLHGLPPTEREVAAALSIPYSTVHADWKRLEERGLVKRGGPDTRRSVVPTVLAGMCPVCGRGGDCDE